MKRRQRAVNRDQTAKHKSRIISLLSEARARWKDGDQPASSNFNYVRERIDPIEVQYFSEEYWTLKPHQRPLVDDSKGRTRIATTLLIDDDEYTARDYGGLLSAEGIHVKYAFNVDDALRTLNHFKNVFDFVIIDIRMPIGDYFSPFDTGGGRRTGVELASEVLSFAPTAKVIALTNSTDALDISWFEAQDDAFYCHKLEYPPEGFVSFIRRAIMKDYSKLKTFIIHGHDKLAALELKNYLQNSLGFSEPIILSEKKSKGMTVIEKLEHYISDADLVFALFTPDDFATQPKESKRARQNVILEFGIVLGMLGRKSGRIFYLYKKGVEIPSDLEGIIYIDISNGVKAAGEEIRLELEEHLQ